MSSEQPIDAGPGWEIDPETLRPRILDLDAFAHAFADDPHRDILIALHTGDPAAAHELITTKLQSDGGVRLRALLGDTLRDLGRHEEAITAYVDLVEECRGGPREAVMRQHLGKALFTAGRMAEAATEFEAALALRIDSGADPALIESSRRALARAQRDV
ncbi:tetratricopeptide repeat protein [Nocardioides limicola]|uniref:tetratricopeptide repeat protein n=1 Tax=Nocardioides limicola TaxID=2803368 RepID=UPI00193B7451|nr:tetratricopeptide repeat protein [Nocardioides sp. DJM-14]